MLDMFPYPSGAGLHVGHVEGYTGTDVYSRYMRMKGFEVLHPMGWDAFGLPAENYAIKNKIAPAESTRGNIDNFRRQIKAINMSYDWEREIDSSDPSYYVWTQRVFILLWQQGLAYKKKAPANWCPSCQTVLANEQVVEGRCERCDTEVVQKDLEQWFFKITDYADRLIDGLDQIDWPKSTKLMQKNWIGRKVGAKIKFGEIDVFTTKPETILGATFVVVAPEHEFAKKCAKNNLEVEKYVKLSQKETNFSREKNIVKTGVFGGESVAHPLTGEKLPVWVADYVLAGTGTGAIMGVPESDERDREFAKAFGLPIKKYELYDKPLGEKMVTYHLRDWLVSRQRYWGAPIPMIYCDKHGWNPVPESQLPVLLPTDVDFKPTGQSPIALSNSFQKDVVCPVCGAQAKREVDTMDTFVDSSWYFLRFCDPKNTKQAWSVAEAAKWMPVDLYVGGAEHTVLHLMYSRFLYKVFYDLKMIDPKGGDEPFIKLRHQGTILGEDSRKMSKRWGNVINPDDIVAKFGADTLRMYEMFMGPFEATKPWSMAGVEGVHRFVGRIERLFDKVPPISSGVQLRQIDKLVKKVGQDIEEMSFNTAIATMMETLNVMAKSETLAFGVWEKFVLVLAPFAPNLADKLWGKMGKKGSVHKQNWPEYDESKARDEKVMVAVQINGRTREVVEEEEGLEGKVVKMDKIRKYIDGKKYKVIYVPGKVINLVVQ